MILSIIQILFGALVIYDGGKSIYMFATITTAGIFPHNNSYRSSFGNMGVNIILQGFGELSFGAFLLLRSFNAMNSGAFMEDDTLTLISNISLILIGGGVFIATLLHLTGCLRTMNEEMEKEYQHKKELGVNKIRETVFTFAYQALNQKMVISVMLLIVLISIRLI